MLQKVFSLHSLTGHTMQTLSITQLLLCRSNVVFIITVVRDTKIYIHQNFVDLNSYFANQASICVDDVVKDDVIHVDNLNKIQCMYGPIWGHYVYVYSTMTRLQLCEINIYKELGTWAGSSGHVCTPMNKNDRPFCWSIELLSSMVRRNL